MIKKYKDQIVELIFFCSVFAVSITPLADYDVWFHIKSGEIISKLGIIHHDVFAYTTAGREWTPYEWLFQLVLYGWTTVLGTNSLPVFVAITTTILIFIFYKIARVIFDLKLFPALVLSFIFFASIFEFIAPRPQIVAYTFFAAELFFIFLYFFKKKNYLWATIPITLIWANMHGSIFLAPLFFAGFAIFSLINVYLLKDKAWFKKFKTLGIFTVITILLTVLPPLGLTQYKLLIRFYENRELISRFIAEWAPLSADSVPFILYLATAIVSLGFFSFTLMKSGKIKEALWSLPFIGLIFSTFLATRNAFYGYFAMFVLLSYCISEFDFQDVTKKSRRTILIVVILILCFFAWLLYLKRLSYENSNNYVPQNATEFVKDQNFSGNMFNEYGYGGYLLYKLYPQHKVYFDGRTDLYLCCEMPDVIDLSYKKQLPDEDYSKVLNQLWSKNNISYVLLRTEKNTVLRKIARILQSDPNWSLVFWDDATVIFIKRDGKNERIIKSFGTEAATPYNQSPYKKGMEEKAFDEYQRMIKIADSSKSRNTIGYLYLLNKDFAKAKAEFEKAIEVYPHNESPYMNLAEIILQDGSNAEAIVLYRKAKELAPDRGLIYIRLGQIIMETTGDREEARKVWEDGLLKTADSSAKEKLQELLSSI